MKKDAGRESGRRMEKREKRLKSEKAGGRIWNHRIDANDVRTEDLSNWYFDPRPRG